MLLLACYLAIKELLLQSNYAFLEYNVLSLEFLEFGLIFSLLFVLSLPLSYLKLRGKFLLLIVPLFLYALLFYIYLVNKELFLFINAEDTLVEYCTSISFLLSSFGLFWLQKFIKIKVIRIGVLLAAIGLFVIAGEEVSWGQRLLNIETPEVIAENNTQGELTLHNLSFIYPLVVPAYIMVGLMAGFIAPVLKILLSKVKSVKISEYTTWIPGYITSLYFLQLSLQRYFTREFHISEIKFVDWDLVIWNEFAEAVAALGVLVFVACLVVDKYKSIKVSPEKKTQRST